MSARVNSDSNPAFTLSLNGQDRWSIATGTLVSGGFGIRNHTRGGTVPILIDAFDDKLFVHGLRALDFVQFDTLGTGGVTALCRSPSPSNTLATCSSSIRYKSNVGTFSGGLDLVQKFRPVTFNWKANNQLDMGLVAEEVAAVEPLLVTHNDRGEIDGVKYDRVGVVLINAVREQQEQIERLTTTIREQNDLVKRQTHMLDALKALVCANNVEAGVCREGN